MCRQDQITRQSCWVAGSVGSACRSTQQVSNFIRTCFAFILSQGKIWFFVQEKHLRCPDASHMHVFNYWRARPLESVPWEFLDSAWHMHYVAPPPRFLWVQRLNGAYVTFVVSVCLLFCLGNLFNCFNNQTKRNAFSRMQSICSSYCSCCCCNHK